MHDAGSTPRGREPLTVLMAVPQYPRPVTGGLEKQAHELATALVQRGEKVLALSGRFRQEQADRELVDGVEVHRLPFGSRPWARQLLTPFWLWRRGAPLIRRADVVHTHVFSGFGLFVIVLARVHGKPVIVKLPNVGSDGLPGLAAAFLGGLRLKIFSLADAVVAMSAESMTELKSIGYDVRRVLATPNGISVIDGAPADLDPRRPCRFVFVGRLHEQKGVLDLLKAVSTLRATPDLAPFTVHLYGDGEQRALIESEIARRGLGEVVFVCGHTDTPQEVLFGHDVFVLPSYREGNSNAILEAMVAGLPVISTRVGGTPMLVGADGAQMLCEPGDVPQLARLMHRLIQHPDLRASLGDRMRSRVLASFDIRRVAQTYADAYRLLAARRRDEVFSVSNPVVLQGVE